jgi:hypothetical protein
VAQWIAHQTSDLGVGGSSPPRDYSTILQQPKLRFLQAVALSNFFSCDCCNLVDNASYIPTSVASLAEWLRRWL